MKKSLKKAHLIFSINSGRCGSHYLSCLLSTAAGNGVCLHEPEPQMCDEWNDQCIKLPLNETFEERKQVKCTSIERTIERMQQERTATSSSDPIVYGETTHMFIKTFYDVVMEHFSDCSKYQIDVILLRRWLPATLQSRVLLGHFADRPHHGWLHTINSVNSALEASFLPDYELDQIDLLCGYLVDIEARAVKFKHDYPHCRVIEASLEALNTWNGVLQLFNRLNLTPTEETKLCVGKVTNVRTEDKEKEQQRLRQLDVNTVDSSLPSSRETLPPPPPPPTTTTTTTSSPSLTPPPTLEYCELRLRSYMNQLQQHGIACPAMPHLVIPSCDHPLDTTTTLPSTSTAPAYETSLLSSCLV